MKRRWTSPPTALRNSRVRLENVALVPASELSSLAKWQGRARSLPAGDTLLVVARNNPRLQEVGRRICQSVSAQDRPMTLVSTHTKWQKEVEPKNQVST